MIVVLSVGCVVMIVFDELSLKGDDVVVFGKW